MKHFNSKSLCVKIFAIRNVAKVRLYPTSEQKLSLAKAFVSCRYIWNYCLAKNNRIYKETGKGISAITMKKWIPQLKKQEETEWLKETYSQCLQSSVINLGIALKNFFEKRGGYPRFKLGQITTMNLLTFTLT